MNKRHNGETKIVGSTKTLLGYYAYNVNGN